MNLRRQRPPDSLEMLLDTMCNTFGGIILLAVLVTLLSRHERLIRTGTASDTQEMLQRRLALAQTNLQQSLQLAASIQSKTNDSRVKLQVNLLCTRRELQERLEALRDAATQTAKDIDEASAADPSERLKALNRQLAAAEAKKLEHHNGLNAAKENSKRLQQRLAQLERQVAATYNETFRYLRLPKEHYTGKRPFYVIVQYGRVYPCRTAELNENETDIEWISSGDSEKAIPIPGRGCGPGDTARLRELFDHLPKDLFYVVFCVYADSFAEFNQAKGLAIASNLTYGWEPFRNQDGPVVFSSVGHRPKPQ